MRALPCVNGVTPTESTEVFTINMASTTTLNDPRKDVESQSTFSDCLRRRKTWWTLGVDIPILLIVLALIGLFELGVIPSHKSGFFCNDPALSFPYTGETVTTAIIMSTLLLIPLVIFYPTEFIFTNSDYAVTAKMFRALINMCLLYRTYLFGLIMNLCVVEIMKGIVGNPRPIFFDVCEPDTGKTCNGSEFVSSYECTSQKYSWWDTMDSYRSFPSGHASMSVYCGLFLVWYLQKRAFDWSHRTVILVPGLQLLSITYAVICSLTRITDNKHHWWDVLAGTGIGVVSFIYAAIVLGDNFKSRPSKESNVIRPEDRQHTVGTLLYEDRRS